MEIADLVLNTFATPLNGPRLAGGPGCCEQIIVYYTGRAKLVS